MNLATAGAAGGWGLGMKVLLGTDICVYLIKNNPPKLRRRFAALNPGDVGVSAITAAELQHGAARSSAGGEKCLRFCPLFCCLWEIFPFDGEPAAANEPRSIRRNLPRYNKFAQKFRKDRQ
jgi:tRNA(fMet)-specific endonuclease VapC